MSKVDDLKNIVQGKKKVVVPSADPDEEPQVLEGESEFGGEEGAEAQGLESADTSHLEQALAQAEEQVRTHKDAYVRLLAEFENFKKRIEREKSESLQYANEKIIKEILTIYDHLEMAIEQSGKKMESNIPEDEELTESGVAPKKDVLLEGVELTLRSFQSTIEKFGVQVISGEGQVFDPNLQESIAAVPNPDVPSHTVLTVHRKGFKLHNRVLRAALVTISQ